MEAKKVDLNEWGYYGEGGTATSYCNKLNGNIYLKLNKAGYPESATLEEFLASRHFSEMGLPIPPVYDFVTDGERFGYTGERIKGKISFARTLSQEPDKWTEIALRFATMARHLHQTKADTSKMKSCLVYYADYLSDLSFVPSAVADKVRGCLEEFADEPCCLHGDFNPGNVITYENQDYWIGVNSFMYGDPCWDLATMYMIANCLPAKLVKERYHLSPSQCRKFYDIFLKNYFGSSWNDPKVKKRICDAAKIKCCAQIKRHPECESLYVPFIRGNRLWFRLKLALSCGKEMATAGEAIV